MLANLASTISFIIEYTIANKGTPIIIPTNPINLPATSNENNIQNADIPIESPNILGPIILPSICCITSIKTKNINAFTGETNNIIIADGIAPKNGPKNGIIFVIPIITDINNVYGILNTVNIANVNTANYKRKYVTFEETLNEVNKLGKIDVKVDNSTSLKVDGNNVDLESEKVNQAANTLMFNGLVSLTNTKLSMAKSVITGR